jgi:hypothetical protein
MMGTDKPKQPLLVKSVSKMMGMDKPNHALLAKAVFDWIECTPWMEDPIVGWGYDAVTQLARIQVRPDAFAGLQRRYSLIPTKRISAGGNVHKYLRVGVIEFTAVFLNQVERMSDEYVAIETKTE